MGRPLSETAHKPQPTNTPVNDHVLMERLTHPSEIWTYLGWNRTKFYKWYRTMLEDGVIFYEHTGRPPRKRMFTFTSLLHRWLMIHSQRGTIF